jgi:hypothetical protein
MSVDATAQGLDLLGDLGTWRKRGDYWISVGSPLRRPERPFCTVSASVPGAVRLGPEACLATPADRYSAALLRLRSW